MFLTAEQVVELTGLVRPSAQTRWLAKNGWKFATRADGRPAVSAREFERHLEGGARRSAKDAEPNLAAVFGAR